MVGVELFATFSEETTREGVDFFLEKKVLGSERFVLGSQSEGFGFERFDAMRIAFSALDYEAYSN